MDTIDNELLGKKIRLLRLKAGFSQKEVADALYCARSTYSYKENGVISFSLNELLSLSKLFGFSPKLYFDPEFYQDLPAPRS